MELSETGPLGARVIPLASVDIGCAVWSSTRQDFNTDPVGGVVIARTDGINVRTGEITRGYLTLNPYGGLLTPINVRWIAETDIGPHGCEVPERSTIARLVRRIARQLSETKGDLGDEERERIGWLSRLAGVRYE
jgi:hypothetical protein